MASAHLRRKLRIGRKREETGSGGDLVFLYDDRTVVQRRFRQEDRGQQVVREVGVERYSAVDVIAKVVLALKNHERAGLVLGEKAGSHHDVVVGLDAAASKAGHGEAAAESHQRVADFGGEKHKKGENR